MSKMKRSIVVEEYTTAAGRAYAVNYSEDTVTLHIDNRSLVLPLEQAGEIGAELCWICADHRGCSHV